MRGDGGRRVAGWTVAVGLVVLVAAGWAGKTWIVEQYYVYELQSTDEEELGLHAADALGEMKSVRAVPYLIRLLVEEKRGIASWSEEVPGSPMRVVVLTPLAYALYRIGRPALPELEEALLATRLGVFMDIMKAINSPDSGVRRSSDEEWAFARFGFSR